MAWASSGGASRQKIDLNSIIKEAIYELEDIETSNRTQSEKTKLYKRLATKIKTALHDDGRKNEESKIALTTYKRYLTRVRNAIKAAGMTHHSLHQGVARAGTLKRVVRDFPEYADILEPIASKNAETVGAYVNEVLKTIQADKDNAKRGAAYTAVKGMKIHHEILYHLHLDDVVKADLADNAAHSLAEKKTNTVKLVHANILRTINENLSAKSYARRAFALALASGRRAIEVLYYASFEKTGVNTVLFNGQAKKQAGIQAASYEIYTLIPADEFIKAFEGFREMEAVKRMHEDFGDLPKNKRNTEINRRTAKTMNESAKYLMADDSRSFKDSRTIYARICLDTFYQSDSKWSETDEDVFLKHLLGHGAVSTAGASHDEIAGQDFGGILNYKRFRIDYESDYQPPTPPENEAIPSTKEEKPQTKRKGHGKEVAMLTDAVEQFVTKNPSRSGLLKYHKKVVDWVAANPSREITLTALAHKNRGGVGGNRDTVKTYLLALGDALQEYNEKRR